MSVEPVPVSGVANTAPGGAGRAETSPIRVPDQDQFGGFRKVTCVVHSRRLCSLPQANGGIGHAIVAHRPMARFPRACPDPVASRPVAPKPDRQRRGGVSSDTSEQLDARRLRLGAARATNRQDITIPPLTGCCLGAARPRRAGWFLGGHGIISWILIGLGGWLLVGYWVARVIGTAIRDDEN
jgi:hypothetical protein